MRYLFVGGPEHGKIQHAQPDAGGVWQVVHVPPPIRVNDFDVHSVSVTYKEVTTYRVREMQLFGEILKLLVAEGINADPRMLDAIIKPEVRDLMY